MINYEKTLMDLIRPIVDDPDSVKIQRLDSINEDEILLYVYANSTDIARLIGRGGSMASAIRGMMSVCSCIDSNKVTIKFESY